MSTRQDLANAIRIISIDAVEHAKSGHPGMPMGMADIVEVLWNDFLHHNPNNPKWLNRDRFVVSNGHGCKLLYAMLHLTGYDLSMEDLKQFRVLHSKTPGHPEYGMTPGVETTTGPLGQGLANAVGMALAEKTLAAQFNREQFNMIDHYTYVLMGDGCLMEGISHEVCSLAGTLGLGKLIAFYDDNGISIDGNVAGWYTEDTPKRFEAYGWHVIPNVDGHNIEETQAAIRNAQAVKDKPSIICCKTQIGFGAPNLVGTSKIHSDPLGAEEIKAVRENLGWTSLPFVIPDEIYQGWDARGKGEKLEAQWNQQFSAYQQKHPELAAELLRRVHHELPAQWQERTQAFIQQQQDKLEKTATRKASLSCLNAYGPMLPELVGGSADLTGSNCTWWSDSVAITKNSYAGNYIHYGVREFGMFAMMNGIALHGGFIPYGGTFLTFVDYGRNALRLCAMMRQQVIFVFTHDSIGLGQDGPTHQPIEHAAMLRLTPGINVWRPCDAVETAVAWKIAIEHHDGPTCLLLTRQDIESQARNQTALTNVARGGYILQDCKQQADAIIIATGSEVCLAMGAAKELTARGINIRVVSMPCTEIFDSQEDAYKHSVLPPQITARVAVEAGATAYWYKYVGLNGKVVGIDRYGESAPAADVFKALGVTVEHVVKAVEEVL